MNSSSLTVNDIERCFAFAYQTWINHKPGKRKPLHLWYDVLQGKLAELTIHKYCKNNNLENNLSEPNFDDFSKLAKSEVQIPLHDLEIKGRKKEIKSSREKHKFVKLSANYFIKNKYKNGNPDDLMFIDMGLPTLGVTNSIFRQLLGENFNTTEYEVEAFFGKYNLSIDWATSRYQCSLDELLEDPFISALSSGINLEDIRNKIVNDNGKYQVAGEISVDDFCKYSRNVRTGYVFNMPSEPCYERLLREFIIVEVPMYTDNIKGGNAQTLDSEITVQHFIDFIKKYNATEISNDNAKAMILNIGNSMIMNKIELKSIGSSKSYIEHLISLSN